MFPFRITRRTQRALIFLVIFSCTFLIFTLAPSKSAISTNPLSATAAYFPKLAHQVHWSAPAPGSNSWDLDSNNLYPEPPTKRPPHTFRPDGLLQVKPGGRHPILDLIEHAEREWDAKLARASKTLPEAVREYHRRYSRAPPPGFDKWWAYVQRHNVQLPDEYDQINTDLAPFWGIDPTRLQAIQLAHESHVHSYTLAKSTPSGPVHVGNESLPADERTRQGLLIGANQLIELMEGIQDELPLFRAVFSPHDNPNVFVTHETRRKVVEAGQKGKPIDPQSQDPPPFAHGWIHACPLNSVARNPPPSLPPHTTKPKTFIHDHLLAMDPCAHPSHLTQHGQFLSHGPGPVAHPFLIPQFSYCSSPLHADIRVPILLSWVDDVEGGEEAWMEKEEERLLWRGLNTGIHHGKEKPWKDAQRGRLMDLVSSLSPSSNSRPEKRSTSQHKTIDVLLTDPFSPDGFKTQTLKKSILNPAMMDIAFAWESESEVDERWEWRRRMGVKEAGKVDGNGWSSRFKRLMTSNSVVFKSTIYPEWFTHRLAPWVHYIPIQIDYSDLYDALLFFRGDPSGTRAREWSLEFWRKEDMVAYLYRYVCYSSSTARVMDENRDSLNFELEL
ncbi:hypothetical protein DFJ58DRAFT_802581 [Suillus subalutaceus]|uniref:uncharacterized protein n=1 Tax=Suillus subalutaceus TaxID=48586 RepID=UPI001B86F9E9|nr:uncharacterized protein DFJ58DRAFT_802581 [Suillus subalutaceus]KAG1844512.1 hypothetical protein DFJ58DRAFT_802581 [Suillus subalutaceus]